MFIAAWFAVIVMVPLSEVCYIKTLHLPVEFWQVPKNIMILLWLKFSSLLGILTSYLTISNDMVVTQTRNIWELWVPKETTNLYSELFTSIWTKLQASSILVVSEGRFGAEHLFHGNHMERPPRLPNSRFNLWEELEFQKANLQTGSTGTGLSEVFLFP